MHFYLLGDVDLLKKVTIISSFSKISLGLSKFPLEANMHTLTVFPVCDQKSFSNTYLKEKGKPFGNEWISKKILLLGVNRRFDTVTVKC